MSRAIPYYLTYLKDSLLEWPVQKPGRATTVRSAPFPCWAQPELRTPVHGKCPGANDISFSSGAGPATFFFFFFGAHIVCSKTNASEVRLLFAGFAS